MNNAHEKMKGIQKEISQVHLALSEKYRLMSKRNDEFLWSAIERDIHALKEKEIELRLKLKDAIDRFVNWKNNE